MDQSFSLGAPDYSDNKKYPNIISLGSPLPHSQGLAQVHIQKQTNSINFFTVQTTVKDDFLFRIGVFKERKIREFRKFINSINEV